MPTLGPDPQLAVGLVFGVAGFIQERPLLKTGRSTLKTEISEEMIRNSTTNGLHNA
jgi:hypothetical protein